MSFQEGYKDYWKNVGALVAAQDSDEYIQNVKDKIDELVSNINNFKGYNTPSDKLKGDIAEYWHSGTFNIKAAVEQSKFKTDVDRSHGFASPDISSNFDIKYGLKYYKNGVASAKAQSLSYFERYSEYKSLSGKSDLSFTDFLNERGICADEVLMHDSIYGGQVRIIPSDQLEQAVKFLKERIKYKSCVKPELVAKYEDTLNMLSSKISSPDNKIHSIELTEQEARQIAEIAKKGQFDASDFGISAEELISVRNIVTEGIKAGTSAAIISVVMKVAPEIIKCIQKRIKEGEFDEADLKQVGCAAREGLNQGFIRGFIAASLTSACKSGMLGSSMKSIDPTCIGALTAIFMETMSDSFRVASGDMPSNVMMNNLIRNVFVSSVGVGTGIICQTYLAFIPGAYFVGNFVGTITASIVYESTDNAVMTFCVDSGCTFFGLVEQNYKLPQEILDKLGGIDKPPLDNPPFDNSNSDVPSFDNPDLDNPEFIQNVMKRGLIGFHKVGYICF